MTAMAGSSGEDPFTVHFLAPITIATSAAAGGNGSVVSYGQELLVDPRIRRINQDRNGACLWLDLLDDEAGQVKRWGRVMVRRGPWPEGQTRIDPTSKDWRDAREAAHQQARKILNETKRATALQEVSDHFGDAAATRRTAAGQP